MKPVNCFICQTKSSFYQQTLKNIRTKHSKRPVVEFIEDLSQKYHSNDSIKVALRLDDTCVCYECLDKIDVYDLAISTVRKIEREFEEYFEKSNHSANTRIKNENVGKSSNSEQHDANQSNNECDQNTIEMWDKEDTMSEMDFNNDDDNNKDSSDENTEIDVNMYITDCKVCHFQNVC